jgi:hypothetical protein
MRATATLRRIERGAMQNLQDYFTLRPDIVRPRTISFATKTPVVIFQQLTTGMVVAELYTKHFSFT